MTERQLHEIAKLYELDKQLSKDEEVIKAIMDEREKLLQFKKQARRYLLELGKIAEDHQPDYYRSDFIAEFDDFFKKHYE